MRAACLPRYSLWFADATQKVFPILLILNLLSLPMLAAQSTLVRSPRGVSSSLPQNGRRFHIQMDVGQIYDNISSFEMYQESQRDLEEPSSLPGISTLETLEEEEEEPKKLVVQLGFEAECALRATVVELVYKEKLLETEPKTTEVMQCVGSCYGGGYVCGETSGLDYLLEITVWDYPKYHDGYTSKFIELHNATSCGCNSI